MICADIIFIVGPTAVGKSEVGFYLAKRLDGEIVSCDSMQVYREINIASNKPSPETRRAVPHHMIDIVSITESFDVARFNVLARRAIEGIEQRRRVPIVVGGSGLYMQVLLDGIFEGGQRDEAFRRRMWALAKEKGPEVLHGMLTGVDPEAARKIHPRDIKKTIRALEVCQRQGRPISEAQKDRRGLWEEKKVRVFALNQDREHLYAKINQRVERMAGEGLLEEIQRLKDWPWSQTARGLIGVKEVLDFFNGKGTWTETLALIQRNTRRLAKRQLTWFRRDPRIEWVDVPEDGCLSSVAERIYG